MHKFVFIFSQIMVYDLYSQGPSLTVFSLNHYFPHTDFLCLSSGDDLDDDLELVEELALQVYRAHPTLLSRGFALSHPPTIHQTLDGVIPFR